MTLSDTSCRLGQFPTADDTGVGEGKDAHRALLTYVRDDRPFGGRDPPAAVFFYSRDRTGEHPERHLAATVG